MKPLIILLILSLPLSAAVITGNVKDTALAPAATNISFTPLSTPMSDAPTIIFSSVQTVQTDAAGNFSLTLAPGNYKVAIGENPKDAFLISVPAGAGTNAWTDLATGALTYRFPYSPAYVDRIIATTRGDLFVYDGTNVVRLGAGAPGDFLGSDPAAAAGLRWGTPPSPWVQMVHADFTNWLAVNAVIPVDDTLPQSNEGSQTVTATITPRGATNFLHVQFHGGIASAATIAMTTALFRDNEASAVAAVTETISVGHLRVLTLSARVPAQSTNAQTFKIRFGPASASTTYVNGNSAGRLLGGAMAHRLVIMETN